jgi:hydrogenase/urease accessory protein HupE
MTRSPRRRPAGPALLLALLPALLLGAGAGAAQAHTLRPAIVSMEFRDARAFTLRVQLNLEAVLAGIGPQHVETNDSPLAPVYNALRALPPEVLAARTRTFVPDYLAGIRLEADGQPVPLALDAVDVPPVGNVALERLSVLTLAGTMPEGARAFTWAYAERFGSNVLRVGPAGEPPVRSLWLTAGTASEPLPLGRELLPRSRWAVALDYLLLGFEHIVPLGLDHILFVLGIYLLSLHWRPLLAQVTAFTIAHSITLGLSLYGYISLPATVVEPLIALSIVYVALENIVTRELKPWRVFVVFGFGLLHGMGFAGVLLELGLPRSEFLTALITFNVGVELGQLTVIGGAFLAVGLWFRHHAWYRPGIVIPASAAISAIGAWWTVERIFL